MPHKTTVGTWIMCSTGFRKVATLRCFPTVNVIIDPRAHMTTSFSNKETSGKKTPTGICF
jgi:hypothetical protein